MKDNDNLLTRFYIGIGAAAMGLLAALVIFTVIARYCFALSWKSVSEFNVTLFAFTTFWGMGVNVLKDEHVSITILSDKFTPAMKRWSSIFNGFIVLIVDCVFVYYSWLYAARMGKQISQGMEVPMLYMYGIMPVCGVICALCIIVKMIQNYKAPLSEFAAQEHEQEGEIL